MRGGLLEARAIIRSSGDAEIFGCAGPVPWWSFTKTALAVALLRLWEDGRVALDEPVDGKPWTPAQLLRHEAGLTDYGSLAAYHADVAEGRPPWTVDALMEAADVERLHSAPGRGWAYSNIGYLYVARLIERASDRPLADALDKFVFAPAEIASARLAATPADLADVEMGGATGYHPGWVYHGLVVGTALDAARLLRHLLLGRLVGPATLSRMVEPRPLPQFRSERYPDPGYGLGLMLRTANPLDHPIGHTGSGPGSDIAVYGRRETTCVVWVASQGDLDPVDEAFRTLEGG